jgi:hypothetical protein
MIGHLAICVIHKWQGDSMATPGQLVHTIADLLGIPPATVVQYDRQLAEAGLRKMKGRGSSASQITAADAANLLIAILGAPISGPTVKSASETCELFGSLPVNRVHCDARQFRRLGLRSLSELPKKHTFREAIAALIDGASRGELFRIVDGNDVLMEADFFFWVSVENHTSTHCKGYQWAEILGDSSVGEGKEVSRLAYNVPTDPAKYNDTSDLRQKRSISFRTLRLLGALIGGSTGHERSTRRGRESAARLAKR